MKSVFFFLIFGFSLSYGQVAKKEVSAKKDSVAISNVNSIVNFSRKNFLEGKKLNYSELTRNQNELLRNVYNFNSFSGNSFLAGFPGVNNVFLKNPAEIAGEMLMNITVYRK